jgi:hypothetical protein
MAARDRPAVLPTHRISTSCAGDLPGKQLAGSLALDCDVTAAARYWRLPSGKFWQAVTGISLVKCNFAAWAVYQHPGRQMKPLHNFAASPVSLSVVHCIAGMPSTQPMVFGCTRSCVLQAGAASGLDSNKRACCTWPVCVPIFQAWWLAPSGG